MSIPLIQKPDKDDINTSIIAIKRNIERINMLLGLSNSEEIDTSKFATKEELQQAVTDLQPVDEVAIDNMHSVTSNAVERRLSGVSPMNYLRDDGYATITYRVINKVIIFSVYAKTNGIIGTQFNTFSVLPMTEGMKTSLCWGGSCVGEAYIPTDGSGIFANMTSGSNGSGQIVAFLA
jgi:hypothetical protein